MTINKIFTVSALILAVAGCSFESGNKETSITPVDMGPMNADAMGTLSCSAGSKTYDQVCGFRVVRKSGGAAEIWISNIAHNDKVLYRVLYFAKGEFTTRGGDSLDYSRESNNWMINANGNEFYKIPDAVIVGG